MTLPGASPAVPFRCRFGHCPTPAQPFHFGVLRSQRFPQNWVRHPKNQNLLPALHTLPGTSPGRRILPEHHSSALQTKLNWKGRLDAKKVVFFFKQSTVLPLIFSCMLNFYLNIREHWNSFSLLCKSQINQMWNFMSSLIPRAKDQTFGTPAWNPPGSFPLQDPLSSRNHLCLCREHPREEPG